MKELLFLWILLATIPTTSAGEKLVIYTYESLLSGFDFVSDFASVANISVDKIQLILFADANCLLAATIASPSPQCVQSGPVPAADVIIGLDNTLEQQEPPGLFLSLNASSYANVSSDLITALDKDGHLLPYDYGIIAIVLHNEKVIKNVDSQLQQSLWSKNFSLDELAEPGVANFLGVQNPNMSSTGLAFFLMTIAWYGDPQTNVTALSSSATFKDWRQWWKTAVANNVTIFNSWDDSWNAFSSETSTISLAISYGLDPAYAVCTNSSDHYSAILPSLRNSVYAWAQIEGIGIIATTQNLSLSEEFVQYFESPRLQVQIWEHQWMYPVLQNVSMPPCFSQSQYVNMNNVTLVNNFLNQTSIKLNMNNWINDWYQIAFPSPSPSPSQSPSPSTAAQQLIPSLFLILTVTCYLL